MTREEIKLLSKYINCHLYKCQQIITPDLTSELTSKIILHLLSSGYVDQNFEWTKKFQNSPSTLLYLEARSAVGNHLGYHRAKKRAAIKLADVPVDDLTSRQPDLPLDLQIDLKAFMECLDERNKIIIQEYQKGYDYREIADRMSVSIGAIEKRLQKIQYSSSEYFQTRDYKRLKEIRDKRYLKKAKLDLEKNRRHRQKITRIVDYQYDPIKRS